jgi:hypothetical protein
LLDGPLDLGALPLDPRLQRSWRSARSCVRP